MLRVVRGLAGACIITSLLAVAPSASAQTSLQFDWGAGVSPEDRALIEDTTKTAITAFDARFNLVATTLTVYATSNDQEWDDATTDYLGHPYCCGKGISAFPEAIFVATDVPHWTMEPSWGVPKERNQMGAVLHEYAHILQYQNAGLTHDNTNPCEGDCFWLGPRWLAEGGAEFTRSLVEHDLGWNCYDDRRTNGHPIAELQAAPRPEDISTRAGWDSHPDAAITAALAGDFLATRNGNSALLYPGNFSSWADPAAFYAAYETEREAGFTYLDHTSVAPCQNAGAAEPSCDNEPPTNTMQFDVGPDVPDKNLALIRCGLANGQDFLDRELGGGIPDNVLAGITVKVVASGNGNQESGGGGSCCTAFSMSTDPPGKARPFFDVFHPHWTNERGCCPGETHREKIVVHEFAHAWQWSLGCIKQTSQPLGMWLNEGVGEQVAWAAMIDNGSFTKDEIAALMKMTAIQNGEWELPLEDMSATESPIWPGNIGYIALEFAMSLDSAPHGLMSLRTICEEVADGATREEAFQTTFGVDLDSFYAQFEAWKDAQAQEASPPPTTSSSPAPTTSSAPAPTPTTSIPAPTTSSAAPTSSSPSPTTSSAPARPAEITPPTAPIPSIATPFLLLALLLVGLHGQRRKT